MSILPLDRLMRELAAYLGTPLRYEGSIYRLIVPLAGGRQQEVSAAVRADDEGRPIIAFVSTIGAASGSIDAWRLLQVNGEPIYSRIALLGNMLAVIACQLLHTAQPEEVLLILREVAVFADRLERALFLGDEF
ncbi:hypothetical protein [Kallotenue papyrolyticum]|uniref:hypothetical protein n=1 Tax=Kallotenue papyrolyticum TaxID=1325125 RepID=UPI0012684972|nr:hypothetical protein [Kallotenue papyrolyticum]